MILGEIGVDGIVADFIDDPIGLAADADAVLTTYFPLGGAEIHRLEPCRVIARYGIGVDNIDLQAARRRGIVVSNVPDYSVEEVAAYVLLLILAALRRLPTAMQQAATRL